MYYYLTSLTIPNILAICIVCCLVFVHLQPLYIKCSKRLPDHLIIYLYINYFGRGGNNL